MDLYHNDQADFTRWVIANAYLQEPFVAIDVGVQGGEHVRWGLLGDRVRVYGFDALSEAIDRITAQGQRPNRVYRAMAIGNEDGEREFYVPENTFASSFYREVTLHQKSRHGDGAVGARLVPIRRLDTLFAQGELPAADYIKIDCEGYDPEVLRGAQTYLARSNILSVTVETSLDPSPRYPRTAFAEINDLLVRHRLAVFDINSVRIARPAYVAARERHPWPPLDPMRDVPDLDVGRPTIFDFFFCRDFVAEDANPGLFASLPGAVTEPTVDKLIKSMINFELHGLMDCAVHLAEHFRAKLASRFDVDEAVRLLVRRPPHARNMADVIATLRVVAALRSMVMEKDQHIAILQSALREGEEEAARERTQLQQALRTQEVELKRVATDFEGKLVSSRFLAGQLSRAIQARILRRPITSGR